MSIDSWGCGDSLKMIFLKGISAVMVIQYSAPARRIEDFFSRFVDLYWECKPL